MQIVIDIDDSTYEAIEHEYCILPPQKGLLKVLWGAIKNGTPLPKGHGDLIDRDELLKEPIDTANYPSNYVRIAPTIIEADKESEDKE